MVSNWPVESRNLPTVEGFSGQTFGRPVADDEKAAKAMPAALADRSARSAAPLRLKARRQALPKVCPEKTPSTSRQLP